MKLGGSNIYCAIRFFKENFITIHYLIDIVMNSNNILEFDIILDLLIFSMIFRIKFLIFLFFQIDSIVFDAQKE